MRTKVLLAVVMIFGYSICYADVASEHKETEELMQYMEADKALNHVKQRFVFMAREMAKAEMDESKVSKEELAKQEVFFRKLDELVNKELTWDKVKTSFTMVFEEVFTEAERADLLKFYRSPAGIAYKKKFPMLTLKLIEAGQKSFVYVLPELEKLREGDIENEVNKDQDKK